MSEPLQIASPKFMRLLQRLQEGSAQVEINALLEADCLRMLRAKKLAFGSDTVATLGADAQDILLETQLDVWKQFPLFASDTRYQDGVQRERALWHIFNCNCRDFFRSHAVQRRLADCSLDDPIGDGSTTLGEITAAPEAFSPEQAYEQKHQVELNENLAAVFLQYAALDTDPANLISYLYKTFCVGFAQDGYTAGAGERAGKIKRTLSVLNGMTCREALRHTHRCLEQVLGCPVPEYCLHPLYAALEKTDPRTGQPRGESVMALTEKTASDRHNWIRKKSDAAVAALLRPTEE